MKEVRVTFYSNEGLTRRVYECAYFEESPTGALRIVTSIGETVAAFATGVWTAAETVDAEEDPS
jgi:hypothetical protein